MPETSLADGLAKLCGALVLSTEHQQIKRLIDDARRVRLTPSAVALVDRILDTAPWTLEHSLDAIVHPDGRPVWIEFGDEPRRREGLPFGGRDVDLIGYLVSPSPADDNAVVLVVAWRLASGTIHHAYGVVHWHRLDLVAHAANARHRYSRVRTQALARMMALFTVSTPLGFRDIVGEMHLGEDRRLEQAALMDGRLAASGEVLFAFACLALLAGSEGEAKSEDGFEVVEAETSRRGLIGRLGDRFARRTVPRFVRRPRPDAPSVHILS
ncbi:hypothetical protein [Methylobacterium sp. 092160098-2]|uniref:hypothetical protein n=1 Tax=Methylobacterium sp. 092160098-2 TaxID=3025129 RepID=UPI0023819C0B|nr:hypothetical protein [Methylobacterium sp. 092160098-2]MDE4914930.1 hypothetical protein [Methylobacterium sp. 092160098-2]